MARRLRSISELIAQLFVLLSREPAKIRV